MKISLYYRLFSCLTLFFVASTSSLWAYSERGEARRDSILSLITGDGETASRPVYKITKFGAKGNGRQDCRPAFEKAMRAAEKSPTGMHLIVPAGEWHVNGSIHLVSHLTLELEEGAHLYFSPLPSDYLPVVSTSWEGSFCQNLSPFIYGFQIEDVTITGSGTIDGNCSDTFPLWRAKQKPAQQRLRDKDHNNIPIEDRTFSLDDYLRPHLIQFFGCRNITLSDFFITNSPFWCVHLLKCENVICRGLRYDAKLVNNDGIDPEMTRNLLIENIIFNNGDDNVAIKAGRDNDGWHNASRANDPLYTPQPSENIIIRNCQFKGLHGVVIGSEMSAGVRNVFVEDCTAGGYNKRALYIKTNPNRGGFIHDIYFSHCDFDEVEDLFYITSMYAGEGANDKHFTHIHDIYVDDVYAHRAKSAGIVLQGTEALPLENIVFKDVVVDSLTVGFSSVHTGDVILRNCHLGGSVDSAPTQVSDKDGLWDNDKKR